MCQKGTKEDLIVNEFYLSTEFAIDNSKEPLNQQIYRFLKRAIIECRLLPGDPLSENVVSSKFQFKISRQPVREALIKLSENEFVIITPKRTTKVAPISKSDVIQGAQIRCAIEGFFIRSAAENMTDEILEDLHKNLEKQKQSARDYSIRDHFAYDDAFHALILKTAGMSRAWNIIENVKGVMDRVRFLSLEDQVIPMDVTSISHQRILDALEKRDPDLCQKEMLKHINATRESLELTITKCKNKSWFVY